MTPTSPGQGARVSSDPVVAPLPLSPAVRPVPLAGVAERVPEARVRGDATVAVAEVAFDSREAVPGALFFCIPGATRDGHAFANDALLAGAAALVVERWLPGIEAPQVLVPSVRAAMGPMSAVVFGDPASAMTTVGVTGTNGKTTITYLLEAIFDAAGGPSGVIGTTGARVAGAPVTLDRTTPEAPDLQRLLARMRDAHVSAVAMEVSSHAMDQHRADGVVFDVAAFTNLSQDHLDYHGSMAAYFEAKAGLFTPAHARRGIVNADDVSGRRLLERAEIPTTSFALDHDADLRAEDVRIGSDGSSFRVDGVGVRCRLLGRFNVSNALGAFAAARAAGIDDATTARGIGAVPGVPGRLEPVEAGQKFLVMVDYAHTPDSILSVLKAARPLTSGRLIVVFGCGGDRDHAKRPLMGSAATGNADLTFITSDNPRSEDPLAIIEAIEVGAREGRGPFVVEPDRRVAIERAVHEAREGDVVVIAGKGHEPYQELADGTIPFDDREVARDALASARGDA
jgi:UDP-N-acetylmuramoyl-L-alanyl-D-glutamate--2,6-diaminopimelate ligase